jgi:hypothetical protein
MSFHGQDAAPYPNELRRLRTERAFTRAGLVALSERLNGQDPSIYAKVGLTALRNLELGLSRPRLKTARTIAAAVGADLHLIFTSGFDGAFRPRKLQKVTNR